MREGRGRGKGEEITIRTYSRRPFTFFLTWFLILPQVYLSCLAVSPLSFIRFARWEFRVEVKEEGSWRVERRQEAAAREGGKGNWGEESERGVGGVRGAGERAKR